MNERRSDKMENRLESLYSQAGDVEPDAGLDRIIHARADESVRINRSPIKLPWLGGLVTASVAVVALAVVLQQAPPDDPITESLVPQESGEPEAFMAPSLGVQSQLQDSTDAQLGARERRTGAESRVASDRATDRKAKPEVVTEFRRQIAEEQPEAAARAPLPASDDSTLERVTVTGSRINDAEDAPFESRNALVARLRELIEDQRMDQARRLRDQAVELDPELDLPEDIKAALDRPNPEISAPRSDSQGPDSAHNDDHP